MPRNVRNFWLEGQIDGRDTKISGRPQSKDGGFSLTIKQRDGGQVTTACRIWGNADQHGNIKLMVEMLDQENILTHHTTR
jgi:hypothetical protein